MKKKKEDLVAVVTGGASGIGFAIAKRFVQAEIKTVLLGTNATQLKLACETLGELSDFLVYNPVILNEFPGLVKRVVEKYSKIDILVNCEGNYLKKPVGDISDEEVYKIILTNQTAMFCMTREVFGVMKSCGRGSILNISSIAAQIGIPPMVAYSGTKSAIEGLTRSMDIEFSEFGIRVNCIAPGYIKTNALSLLLDKDPKRKKKVIERTPLKRMGKPSEIAEAALFLALPSASYITGAILPVDGGISIVT